MSETWTSRTPPARRPPNIRCGQVLRFLESLPQPRFSPSRLIQAPRPLRVRSRSQLERCKRNERTMRSVNTLVVAILLAASSSSLLAQANSAGAAAVAPPAAKTTPHASKTSAKPKAKSPARKPVESAASPAEVQAAGETEKTARRDPFESLVNRNKDNNAGKNLPPGKAGLQVSTLRLDGIVRSSNGMIAVVSNPQARTYFLREGDQLYDGRVDKMGKDAFGKPVERQVQKRIYASAGEQQ